MSQNRYLLTIPTPPWFKKKNQWYILRMSVMSLVFKYLTVICMISLVYLGIQLCFCCANSKIFFKIH